MKILICLNVWIFTLISAQTILEDGSGNGFDLDGSGALPNTTPKSAAITTQKSSTVTQKVKVNAGSGGDDDEEIYLAGSGAIEGSGTVETADDKYRVCSAMYCWCVDNDRNEIPNTRVYQSKPTCSTPQSVVVEPEIIPKRSGGLAQSPIDAEASTTTVATSLPTRKSELIVPITESTSLPPARQSTTRSTNSVTRSTPAAVKPVQPVVSAESSYDTSTKSVSNNIPTKKPEVIDENSAKQPDDTESKTSGTSESVNMEPVPGAVIIDHPGILAAVVGGGVVGLLCAILLVMFIVYRMRKKDEGSYPLDDNSKPPRLHNYTKASSKEFYA